MITHIFSIHIPFAMTGDFVDFRPKLP